MVLQNIKLQKITEYFLMMKKETEQNGIKEKVFQKKKFLGFWDIKKYPKFSLFRRITSKKNLIFSQIFVIIFLENERRLKSMANNRALDNQLREKVLAEVMDFFRKNEEDVLQTNSNECVFPCF